MGNTQIPLVKVMRGNVEEEIHRGSIVIVQRNKTLYSIGNKDFIVPLRSTAKPFQILPLIERGGVIKYSLSNEDLAVMVSSHNGELEHVLQVQNILSKANLTEKDLHCGVHPPYYSWITNEIYQNDKEGPRAIHNNCSGKHAGMLLLCHLEGYNITDYWKIEHPIQKIILNKIAEILSIDPKMVILGLDGCGVPTYCVPLELLANGYQKLAFSLENSYNSALYSIGKAMLACPFMVAGTNRVDTELMKFNPIIAKSGTSGVFCLAVPERQLGIAIKIESGSESVSECVALEILRQLQIVKDFNNLEDYLHIPVNTWTGERAGQFIPIFSL